MVAALRSTSSGPMASSSSKPSNTTTAIRIWRSFQLDFGPRGVIALGLALDHLEC